MRSTVPGAWIGLLLWVAAAGLSQGPAASFRSPNELGSIMVLEYHRIGEPEARWTRSPTGLRRDLERLWEQGYRPVPLTDLVRGVMELPAGTSPVVLTFDDSSPGQFRYLERDGQLQIDPDCAVGILEAFAGLHPGFSPRATFFVLPAAAEPHRLFGQPEHEARKLRYLVSHGFELGNHTLWHADLSKYPEAVVRGQLARAQQRIEQIVPGYHLRTLALPMGHYPRRLEWAIRGHAAGAIYEHEAILTAGGGPAPSPFSVRFDRYHIPRVQVVGATLANWLQYFGTHPGQRYVSDGDQNTVTIPRGRRRELREDLSGTRRVVELD
jgi:peptidoglycan/xylan/chitin deacetylase (PgdA/CDA1 family)